jgi:hypothetical protein
MDRVQIDAAAEVIREFWDLHPDAPEPSDDRLSLSVDLAYAIRAATEAARTKRRR